MLTIHFSNRYETLAALLAERLAAPGRSDVFSADAVIVPSAAVRRDLTLTLARSHGICANVAFPYLARWLWEAIARVVPGVAAESPFDPALLVWRLYAALTDAAWAAAHPRLQRYLAQSDALMRHELAARLAQLFDQTITFRPDWLAAWSRGELLALGAPGSAVQQDQAWQAELWRRIAPAAGPGPAPTAAFIGAVRTHGAALVADGTLPPELHVFALPTMPPLHLGLLQALGSCAAVHVYALNPCREYWFDVVDKRRLAWLAARGRAEHLEVGNRLLAAWGRQAQASLTLLVDACGEAGVDDARFDDGEVPADATLLAQLQRAILDLRELAPGSIAIADDDRSIEVHVCHSLARELEVLQDRLLGLFAGDGSPEPNEILVVTPDIEAAAPLIDAIFGTAPPDRRIPYQVTGRARTKVNAAARALVDLLALAASRCPVSAVYGLLQQPPVARRFGLDADGLARIHAWLLGAGVHWALDAEHSASLGLPADGRHSLADGLERLFLGYALPSEADQPFAGMLARGAAEGSEGTALGALWRYADALRALRAAIARAPLPPAAWSARLAQALRDFIEPADEEIEDLQEVHVALQTLAGQWARSGCERPQGRAAPSPPPAGVKETWDGPAFPCEQALPLDIVRSAVAAALDDPARGSVPTGGVTFSAMAGLRNIPYRVICAIGLNDGAFPTSARPAEFDLMAAPGQARPGDRQRRIDERNVFLDLLLAARQMLHLSYVGRSVRDNAPLPPSVLVAELLETIVPAVAGATGARFVVAHPLQAFSPEAFRIAGDVRLRSFDCELAQALQHRLAAPARLADTAFDSGDEDEAALNEGDDGRVAEPAQPFFGAPLAAPGDEWLEVSLDRLLQFFVNPSRALLRRRLGLHLARAAEELADDEPFVDDLPARSALAERLLPALLAGADLPAARELARAGTELPAGAFGVLAAEREIEALARFADRLRPRLAEPVLPPQAIALDLAAAGRRWRLHGTLADLRASGMLRYRYDSFRARDALGAWLPHLLLCAGAPPGAAQQTRWLGRGDELTLRRCDDALAQLAQLLELYARGLTEPLAFFPKAAWAYANQGGSFAAAASAWRVNPATGFGECTDPAYRLALRGRPDPLGEQGLDEFERCARIVFDPLLACREDAP